jgi:Domain of unknown function (DUF4258)
LIRFSDHAKKRMVERSIVAEEVEMAVRNPREAIPVRYGRHAVSSVLPDGRFLVVIYEREEGFR